jgi:type I restriction enzyme S subunit
MSSEWRNIAFGDFIALQRGHDLPDQDRRPGSVPILGSFGVTGFHDTVKAKAPGVTVGRSGASFGVAAYTEKDYWPLNTALYVTDFKDNNPKFVFYFLKLFDFSGYNSGSAQPSLNRNNLYGIPIRVPPKPIQEHIADFISAIDDRIELLQETNTTLEAIAQALFKSWFVDFDPVHARQQGQAPEGMDEATAALFPNSFEKSELGLVPKGWHTSSLAKLMDIAGGTQPPASEFVETAREGFIRLIQIRDYETDAHLTFLPRTSKLRLTSKKDIMIARYGASVGRICWGLEGAYNVALVRVVCDENYREFLRSYLQSHVFQERLAAVSGRSAQAGFNKSDIASFKLVEPSNALFSAYQNMAWPLRKKILHNRQQAQTLETLRDTLLPRLISGQLRLPEVEAALEEVAA